MKSHWSLAGAAMAFALSACAPGETTGAAGAGGLPDDMTLNGTGWKVTAVDGEAVTLPVEGDSKENIAFSDGTITGEISCTTFTGTYLNGKDWFNGALLKMMIKSCDPTLTDASMAVSKTLMHGGTLSMADGKLVLKGKDHEITLAPLDECTGCGSATRTADGSLDGNWVMLSLNHVGVYGKNDRYGLSVKGNELSISAGCNSISGPFATEDGMIKPGALAQTEMACDADIMADETALQDILSEPVAYLLSDDGKLLMANAKGSIIFGDASETFR